MKKTKKLIWSEHSRKQLLRITEIIAQDKKGTAIQWIQKVEKKVSRLKHYPLSGRVVPELSRSEIREIIIGNYRIIYKIKSNGTVTILTVFHGSKLFEDKDY